MRSDTPITFSGALGIFGMGIEDWKLVRNANKGIDEALASIMKLRSLSISGTAPTRKSIHWNDSNDWISDGPRVVTNHFERLMNPNSLIGFFHKDRVRKHLISQGHLEDNGRSIDLESDYILRSSTELLLHIRSRGSSALGTPSPSDSDEPASREATTTYNVIDYKEPECEAYNSLFSIKSIPPDKRTQYISSNAPSYTELFLSLNDRVLDTLRSLYYGEDCDFSELESSCMHVDLFIGRDGTGLEYVHDILMDYNSIGYIEILEPITITSPLSEMFSKIGKIVLSRLHPVGSFTGDIGFSFAPCGFLLPYHIGVLSLLSELKIINVTTPLGGASAGTLCIVCSTSMKNDIMDMMVITEKIAESAKREGARYHLDDYLKSVLDREVKPGTYLAVNNRIGPISVAVTSKGLMSYRRLLVTQFLNDSDLKEGVRASCNIPYFSTPESVVFRGKKSYDGYFANLTKKVLCHDTAAPRTVRVNPFIMGHILVKKQRLRNDFIVPMLMKKDTYIMHYLRLKGFIRYLWRRKFHYEEKGNIDGWLVEIALIIDNYEMLSEGEKVFRKGIWSSLINLWNNSNEAKCCDDNSSSEENTEEPLIARLFMLVVASETAHGLGPHSNLSVRNYRGRLNGVNLLSKFGSASSFSPFASLMRFKTTPYCLIDWLRYEYEVTSALHSNYASTAMTKDREVSTLKSLLHAITPPQYLSYYYTEFPYLLPNSSGNIDRTEKALYSCSKADVRFLFDMGRSDAFRWLVCEMISFENWLHLRIMQLEGSTKLQRAEAACLQRNGRTKITDNESSKPLHTRQREHLSECLGFMDTEKLAQLGARSNAEKGKHSPKRLEDVQNRLVRRALMLNVIDPHYRHILCHAYFWEK